MVCEVVFQLLAMFLKQLLTRHHSWKCYACQRWQVIASSPGENWEIESFIKFRVTSESSNMLLDFLKFCSVVRFIKIRGQLVYQDLECMSQMSNVERDPRMSLKGHVFHKKFDCMGDFENIQVCSLQCCYRVCVDNVHFGYTGQRRHSVGYQKQNRLLWHWM